MSATGWVRHKLTPQTPGWEKGWVQVSTVSQPHQSPADSAPRGFGDERRELSVTLRVYSECQDGVQARKEAAANRLASLDAELVALIETIGDDSQAVATRAPQLQKLLQKEHRSWSLLEQQSLPLVEVTLAKGAVCSVVPSPRDDTFKVSRGTCILLFRVEDERERNAWVQKITLLSLSNSIQNSTGVVLERGILHRDQLQEPRNKVATIFPDLGLRKEVALSQQHMVHDFLRNEAASKTNRLDTIFSKNRVLFAKSAPQDIAKRARLKRSGPETGNNSFLSLHWEHKELDRVPENLWQHPQYNGLDVLYLDNNMIGELPPEMSALKSLSILSLCRNKIVILPDWIGTFSELQTFVLAFNRIKELPHSVGNLCKLQTFNLFSNALTKLPIALAKCTCLAQLNLGRNSWRENRGDPPSMMAALPRNLIDGTRSGKLAASTQDVMEYLRERFERYEAELAEHQREVEEAARAESERAAHAQNIYSRKAFLALSASQRELAHITDEPQG